MGLQVITHHTDLYYRNNYYAFVHAADPDFSGMFTFLIQELQKAEDSAIQPPCDRQRLLRSHAREDQAFICYNNNGTDQKADHAVASAWVGPSITPLTKLNSGYRMYEVDTGSWEIFDAYTFYSDVSTYNSLATGTTGPQPTGPTTRRSTRPSGTPVRSPNGTSDACTAAKICHIRSGSVGLGKQCPQGFASAQSKYTGANF
ncbi:hypothetical protein P8C59_005017 [Phyllachora maydis]|uniref:Uncharacterized protein n=1 Tax=Phyllachora maydis TaxID=1825666 RepID=A0AAD9MBU7_9PEZI|nr:hypothetical protein P8C59_005017 [Phyllachora maydis]